MDDLRTFPAELRALVTAVPEWFLRTRARNGQFAVVEHAWHLADLEAEGYGVRLRRMIDEEGPLLADFRGDLVAEQRRYRELDLAPALEKFAKARQRNLELLASLTPQQWQRRGHLEGIGPVTIEKVVELMRQHDAEHLREIRELLAELRIAQA